MAERIDAYSHVTTGPLNERVRSLTGSRQYRTPTLNRLENVDRRIERLDELGVDRQVITQTEQRAWLGHDPGDVVDDVRFANDEVRRFADRDPDRFVPVGTIPFLTGEYVDEFERCVDDLDMVGVEIFSNVDGRHLDDDSFEAFFEAADDAGVPVWIHPQSYPWHEYDDADDWLYTMLGWPFDTSVAIARLVLSGVMAEFEDLQVITHHLGGFVPYVAERLLSWSARNDVDLPEPILSYFDRIYADTAVSSQGWELTLRCGYDFFGADNVLFAADAAHGPEDGFVWMENLIPTIEGMDVPEPAKRKVFAGNVRRLID